MLAKKVRGRRRGTPPPPIRPGPVGGHGEGRGQVVTSGDGLLHPSPGFAPPTGATIAGGTPRTCGLRARIQGRARQLTASDGNRKEARVVAGLDAKQDRPFAAGPRIRESLAHLLRRGDALPCNVENDIAVLEALRRCRTVRIDLSHDHTVRTCARHLVRRSKREAELRNVGAVVVAIAGRGARLALLAGNFARLTFDGLPLPFLETPSFTLVPGGKL